MPWLAEHPNLVLLRTFSKAYGLAGARVGYALSHPEVADVLNRLRPAFNVNSLAQAGAIAALADHASHAPCGRGDHARAARVAAATRATGAVVRALGRQFRAGAGRGRRGADLRARCCARGIIVRPMGGYGLPECLRISIGLPEDNERLLAALAELLPPRGRGAGGSAR